MLITNIPMGYIDKDDNNRYKRLEYFDDLLNDLGDLVLGGDLNKAEKVMDDVVKLHQYDVWALPGNVLIYCPTTTQVESSPWGFTGAVSIFNATFTQNTWHNIVNLDDLIDDINYIGQRIVKYFDLNGEQVPASGNYTQIFRWLGINITLGATGELRNKWIAGPNTWIKRVANPQEDTNHGIKWGPGPLDENMVSIFPETPECDLVVVQDNLSNNIAQRAIAIIDGTFVRR